MAEHNLDTTRHKLQEILGDRPNVAVINFENWGMTQKAKVLSVTPQTVVEVQAVIKAARQLGLRVRATGSGHSFSPLFPDDGNILVFAKEIKRPDGLPQIELVEDKNEPSQRYITMATGVTGTELKEFQLTHGVCLPANVDVEVMSIGGVVSTAAHGVGWDTQTVSDYVVSMRIVDSNGDLCTYSMKDDPDMMRAVQCSLGLWGIIIDLTIKVDPMVTLETRTQWLPANDVFYNQTNLSQLIQRNDSAQIFWFPFNSMACMESLQEILSGKIDCSQWDPKKDEIWVNILNKSEQASEPTQEKIYKLWDVGSWLTSQGVQLNDLFFAEHPQISPIMSKMQAQSFKAQCASKPFFQKMPESQYFIEHLPHAFCWVMEWAFELDDNFENSCKALQGVLGLVKTNAVKGHFPLNILMELRVIGHSDAYMSPPLCSNPDGSGHTFYIGLISMAGTPGWQQFTEQLADIWKQLPGARPHWGQGTSDNGIDVDHIRKSYKEQMPKFLSALERSGVDPDRMFFNKSLETVFYPGGHTD